MDPFRNFVTNLNAPGRGPITVLIAWMFVVAALGIFSHGESADYAMAIIGIVGVVILITLAVRT